MKTRYFSKKNEDAVYFAKCGKDDQDASVQDGRAYRHWKFGEKEGKTLGWEYKTVTGLIESFFVQEAGPYSEERLCIGLQNPEGGFVEVLQFDMCKKDGSFSQDVCGIAKKLPNINTGEELTFGCWHASEQAWKTQQGKTIIPCYVTVQQNGTNVPSAYPYKDGAYEGIPAPEIKVLRGKETKDFAARDEFFFGEIQKFGKMVEALGRKNQRPKTEAEQANPQAESSSPVAADIEEDAPF